MITHKTPPSLAALVSCATLFVTIHLSAQDWPQWRGPGRDARAAGFKAPAEWPNTLVQKWKISVGEGVATPALVGDRLYVFSRENSNEVLRCLNAATGKELWQDKYPSLGASGPASRFSGPRSSPAVANGKVVTMGVRGTLSCLDAATGKVLWRNEGKAKSWPRFFTSCSPVMVDGLCIIQLGGESAGSIAAIDLATGDEKWSWNGDGTSYASPVVMTVGDTKLIVSQTANKMVALEADGGKLAWETPFKVQGRGYNTATPIIDGQTIIYTGSGRGTTAVKFTMQGGSIKATELWSNKDGSVQFNTPVLADGLLFGLNQGNEFFCVNTKTGQTGWTAPVARTSNDQQSQGQGRRRGGRSRGGYGSIVAAGPVVLALTPASELIAFKAGDKAYSEIARIKVADSPTYAYPVLSGNRIFIKDQESVALLTF